MSFINGRDKSHVSLSPEIRLTVELAVYQRQHRRRRAIPHSIIIIQCLRLQISSSVFSVHVYCIKTTSVYYYGRRRRDLHFFLQLTSTYLLR